MGWRTASVIDSDDLAVRAAGVEVDIAGRNLVKDGSIVDRLEPLARWGEQEPRANALWDLALIGNRGVEPDRVFQIIIGSLHDENHNIRDWAVEGLAYLATDAAIAPLLDTFHDDPLPMFASEPRAVSRSPGCSAPASAWRPSQGCWISRRMAPFEATRANGCSGSSRYHGTDAAARPSAVARVVLGLREEIATSQLAVRSRQ